MNGNPSTLTTILDGISKTLNVANRALPLYKEAKPLINNMKSAYTTIKDNKNDLSNMLKLIKIKKEIKKDSKMNLINTSNQPSIDKKTTISNINNPTFFI